MARRARPSSGRWVLSLALLAAAGAAALWLALGRAPASGPAPDPVPSAAAIAAPVASPPVDPPPEAVRQALAEAPLLEPESARALLAEAARRGMAPPSVLDHALLVSSAGFPDLDRATLDELGTLFTMIWSKGSPAERARVQAYLGYVRAGEPLSPELAAAGRELFARGVRGLPPASRARLSVLFSVAVQTGIAHQRAAEERLQRADLDPAPELPPAPAAADQASPPAGASLEPANPDVAEVLAGSDAAPGSLGSSASASSEAYWRSRASQARAAVAGAEKRVHDLEEQATRGGPLVPGPLPPACQAGIGPSSMTPVQLRDASRGVVSCNGEILRQQAAQRTQAELDAARESLSRAKQALDALDDEARRAGALPGWLR